MNDFEPNQAVWFVASNQRVIPAKVFRVTGDMVTVKYRGDISDGAIRLRRSRIFATEEAARNSLPPKRKAPEPQRPPGMSDSMYYRMMLDVVPEPRPTRAGLSAWK